MTVVRLVSKVLTVALTLVACARLGLCTDFYVTVTDDPTPGSCGESHCSLREAILAANASPGLDVIRLPAGHYTMQIAGSGEDLGATGDYDILDEVMINGSGAGQTIIDGNGLDRVFHVRAPSGWVVFSSVTITGGVDSSNWGGGGVCWEAVSYGAKLVPDTEVTGNTALTGRARGGGALVLATKLVVVNTNVHDNDAGFGGGIYSQGEDYVYVAYSAVYSNRAETGDRRRSTTSPTAQRGSSPPAPSPRTPQPRRVRCCWRTARLRSRR